MGFWSSSLLFGFPMACYLSFQATYGGYDGDYQEENLIKP